MEQKWVNSIIFICIILVVFQVLSTYVHYANQPKPDPLLEKPEEVQIQNEEVKDLADPVVHLPETHQILLYEQSVDPENVIIKKGDTVKWTNMGKNRRRFWINEEIYSDLLEPEQSYEYTFEKSGDNIYRDVFNGLVRGNITVEKKEIDQLTGNLMKNIPPKYKNIVGAQLLLLLLGLALFVYPYKTKKTKKTKSKKK